MNISISDKALLKLQDAIKSSELSEPVLMITFAGFG